MRERCRMPGTVPSRTGASGRIGRWRRPSMVALAAVPALLAAAASPPNRVQQRPKATDSVQAFRDPELHAVIARELGPRAMRRAEADQDVSVPVEDHDGILLGWSCRTHECGENQVLWAIERDGTVHVRLLRDGRKWSPASPPREVEQLFDGVGR